MILVSVACTVFGGQYAIIDGQLVATGGGNVITNTISFVDFFAILLYTALLSVKTSLAYGKGASTAVGLFFFAQHI